MNKNIQFIRNPLTIIGAFASFLTVSGNWILPKLNETCQFYYMWFLMIFPFLLVTFFFIVLWFRPKNLYAPSDFQDENNFLKCMFPATKQDIINQKIQDVELEKTIEVDSKQKNKQKENENKNFNPYNRLKKYLAIERAAIGYVARKYNTEITQEIGIHGQSGKIFFDGVFYKDGQRYFLEIKYATQFLLIQRHIDCIIGKLLRSNVILPNDTLLLIFIYGANVRNTENNVSIPQNLSFKLKIDYISESELNLKTGDYL